MQRPWGYVAALACVAACVNPMRPVNPTLEKNRERLQLEASVLEPVGELAPVHEMRKRLRGLGGDRELDTLLLDVLARRADARLQQLEAMLPYDAARYFGEILRYPDLPDTITQRANAIRDRAIALHTDLAGRAGATRPLMQRAHLGLAFAVGGPSVDSADEVLRPYGRTVTVSVTGTPCAPLDTMLGGIARASGPNEVAVEIRIDRCTSSEDKATRAGEATWVEPVIDHYEDCSTTQQSCWTETETRSLGYYDQNCFRDYRGEMVCESRTVSVDVQRCEDVVVPATCPVYRDEPRSAPRDVHTITSTADLGASIVVTRDGKAATSALTFSESSVDDFADPVGGAAADPYTGLSSAALLEKGMQQVVADASSRVDAAFQNDRDAAAAEAERARDAGRTDDAEEAEWRIIALGGAVPGLDARYGAGASAQAFFATSAPTWTAESLPPIADVDPTDDEDWKWSPTRLTGALGGRPWVHVGLDLSSNDAVPYPMAPSIRVGAASGFRLSVRGGLPILSRNTRAPEGRYVVDDLGVELGVGTATSQDEMAEGFLSYGATLGYAAGYAVRTPRFGVIGGVRPTAGLLANGATGGRFLALPVFARGEWMLRNGSIALEGSFGPLGNSLASGTLYVTETARKSGARFHRYLSLRVQRVEIDGDFTQRGFAGAPPTVISFEDQPVTEYSFSYGWGF